MDKHYLSIKNSSVLLQVYVQPGAKSTHWSGVYGDAIKIRLSAPPVDGKANEALCQFLAAAFGRPNRSVRVLRGQTSRAKTVELTDAADQFESIQQQIEVWVGSGEPNQV